MELLSMVPGGPHVVGYRVPMHLRQRLVAHAEPSNCSSSETVSRGNSTKQGVPLRSENRALQVRQ
jgi:hypothetical protein